jgi:hypothetical protein
MYSKQEESLLREHFWTTFGQYMSPVLSAESLKINWVNYKTGIRFMHVKMEVQNGLAYIGIEFSHNDLKMQGVLFDHFKLLQVEFEKTVSEKWIWEQRIKVTNKEISRIYILLKQVNIYKKEDWPQIISFLKNRIILLDVFWCKYREIFTILG